MFESILLVEDDSNSRKGLTQFLQALDYDVITAANGREGFDLFKEENPDLVIADIRMPEMDGVTLLEKIREEKPSAKVILLTAYGSVEDAVKAMKKGAFYYLTKPVNLEELELLVKKTFSSRQLEEENRELKREIFSERYHEGTLIAESPKMKELLRTADKIAASSASVLIEGESGTGKELIARRIHEMSPRSQNPFVAVHCAALTETLLSSELFGHEKGAFTGAVERRQGRFERAHQGSLFLDEIGEISKDTQVKLLRVLQEGEFERVGGVKTIKVDVRLIAATNKTLIDEVKKQSFREDLYYRINVIYLKMPPLRERKEDIPPLVNTFMRRYGIRNGKKLRGIAPDALEALLRYDWPGNVRELKNIVERMIVLSAGEELTLDQVPDDIRGPRPVAASFVSGNSAVTTLTDAEKELIRNALRETNGNKSKAAEKLGISRRTLYRKIEEYQIG
ncbi:MAG TPA: sigma-54 dependent transcriptional regulator [Candidatus Omnitrophota bacterium]|jgi:DNA-binding NtrC family response regulator|nr:MAG: Transcriptional regulatory protein ZraR [Candidatus Omnitrophica bacterium ADurb.Bin314]HQB94303.1 sigma-54 dependent transcriptional regulator [Candidatus Omnitrophota bacterium]